MPPLPRYQPSMRVSSRGIGLLALCLLASVPVAFAYDLFLDWVPILQLRFAATVGVTIACLIGVETVVRRGNVRNPWFSVLAAFCLGGAVWIGSFFFGYLGDLRWAFPDGSSWAIASREGLDGFRAWVLGRVEAGFISGRDGGGGEHVSKGFKVWLAWGLEGAAIIGFPAWFGVSRAREVFCERCEKWADRDLLRIPGTSGADVESLLAVAHVDALVDLSGPPGADALQAVFLVREHCPGCAETSFVTVKDVALVPGPNGGSNVQAMVLAERLTLTADQDRRLGARIVAAHDA